jgi:hypothetical protein
LQASQTQISSSVLPDIWYLYLIISVKSRRLFDDFPMPALGRAVPADDPTGLEFLNISFHRPFGNTYFFLRVLGW